MSNAVNGGRRIVAGRSIRWDEDRANEAYAQGFWVRETLADALARAASDEPDRILIIDGAVRIDARSLHAQASALAQAMAARTMTGRNGEMDDLAGALLFLASRASDYVTGQTLFVDGGFSAG